VARIGDSPSLARKMGGRGGKGHFEIRNWSLKTYPRPSSLPRPAGLVVRLRGGIAKFGIRPSFAPNFADSGGAMEGSCFARSLR